MKQIILVIVCIWLIVNIAGCGPRDKSKILAQYKYDDSASVSATSTVKKLEPWVKEGVNCWGIIMVTDNAGNPLRIKEVHVKVIGIKPQSVKLQALENVILGRTIQCNKVTFKKGDSWNEEYGDLFKTREEAIKYIDDKYPKLRIRR